jgi:branched-chain amino acid transport system permease protein
MTRDVISHGAIVLLVGALIALPWVLPFFVSSFWVTVAAEILIWSLLAASVNLLFDFGFGFWPALLVGVGAASVMALVAGSLAVRLTWHYFAIITVVFSLIFYFAAMSARSLTGGDDGRSFSPPPVFQAGGFELLLTDATTQYYLILGMVLGCYAVLALIIKSPLGLAFAAIRENDRRAELIGINVYRTRLVAFVIAGAMAGLAGALFAFYGRYASASYMFYHVSGEAVVWAIVGGAGTLFGPLVGTAALIIFRELVSTWWEHYLLAVGAITILVVMFAPKGIVGFLNDCAGRLVDDPSAGNQGEEPAKTATQSAPALEPKSPNRGI